MAQQVGERAPAISIVDDARVLDQAYLQVNRQAIRNKVYQNSTRDAYTPNQTVQIDINSDLSTGWVDLSESLLYFDMDLTNQVAATNSTFTIRSVSPETNLEAGCDSGGFTLLFGGDSCNIAYNDADADIEAAINALPSFRTAILDYGGSITSNNDLSGTGIMILTLDPGDSGWYPNDPSDEIVNGWTFTIGSSTLRFVPGVLITASGAPDTYAASTLAITSISYLYGAPRSPRLQWNAANVFDQLEVLLNGSRVASVSSSDILSNILIQQVNSDFLQAQGQILNGVETQLGLHWQNTRRFAIDLKPLCGFLGTLLPLHLTGARLEIRLRCASPASCLTYIDVTDSGSYSLSNIRYFYHYKLFQSEDLDNKYLALLARPEGCSVAYIGYEYVSASITSGAYQRLQIKLSLSNYLGLYACMQRTDIDTDPLRVRRRSRFLRNNITSFYLNTQGRSWPALRNNLLSNNPKDVTEAYDQWQSMTYARDDRNFQRTYYSPLGAKNFNASGAYDTDFEDGLYMYPSTFIMSIMTDSSADNVYYSQGISTVGLSDLEFIMENVDTTDEDVPNGTSAARDNILHVFNLYSARVIFKHNGEVLIAKT